MEIPKDVRCSLLASLSVSFSLCALIADTSTQIARKAPYGKERSVALNETRCDGWIWRAREMDGEESEI